MPPPPSPPPGLGRPLHVSEMRTMHACPRKWEHAYRSRRVPVAESQALSRGRQVHRWLERWWTGTLPDAFETDQYPSDPIARACCIGYDAFYKAPSLKYVRVELPFRAEVGGVEVAGTVDAIGSDGYDYSQEENGDYRGVTIVEHKTTSQDISPGSLYWRQVVTTDPQVSMYRAAFPGAVVLYDVIRKPALRQKTGESEEPLVARCLEDMAGRPEHYFQRAHVVRLESEDAAFADDVRVVDAMRRLPMLPRNPASCFEYGTRCGYYGVCWEGASLDGPEFREQDPDR